LLRADTTANNAKNFGDADFEHSTHPWNDITGPPRFERRGPVTRIA
jgi:hypothetical protein